MSAALPPPPPGVTVEIREASDGPRRRLQAAIASVPPQALRWRLEVSARGPGGAAAVSQSGRTDGRPGPLVGSVLVNADAQVEAHLTVTDAGGAPVAFDQARFGPPVR